MQNITELSQFNANVPYLEVTDPVIGGTGGESNAAVIALVNRSRFLYDYLGGLDGVTVLTGAAALGAAHLRKLIYINVTGNTAFTVDALSNFLTGQRLVIKVKCPAGKCISLIPNGSEVFANGTATQAKEWLCDGEEITLVKRSSTQWEIIGAIGNFNQVGNDALVRLQPKNTIIAQGQEVLRADYERLWDRVQAGAVSESAWFSSGLNYQCFFSTGDTVSTFRLPDMRAMHWRGLDLGRGISLGRVGFGAGGYEADEIKAHSHTMLIPLTQHTSSGPVRGVTDGPGATPASLTFTTASNGQTENTVKTAGLTPVIYY